MVRGADENLLSRDAAVKLNLIGRIGSINDMPEGIGLMKTTPVKITLCEGARPYSIPTPRRIPLPLLPKVKEELARMEQHGVIVRVTEPTEWCAPMIPVVKPGKAKAVRICVDLRKLNKSVQREKYVLPTVDDILHNLAESNVFTSLDAQASYWQLPLEEGSSKYTTFITPLGRYMFIRVPFGITSASEVYQRKMHEILGGIEGVEIYQDDILVHGESVKQHAERLDRVWQIINQSGIRLNKAKCVFRKKSLEFLGHKISEHGVKS